MCIYLYYSNLVLTNLFFQVVWAGAPGQEAGNSIADVLYGDFNPSGRLPYTIAKQLSDYSAQLTTGGGPNDILSIPYSEALNIDYRHFDAVSTYHLVPVLNVDG